MERDGARGEGQESGSRPSDTEGLVGDTPTSEPLTTASRVQPPERASRGGDAAREDAARGDAPRAADAAPTGEDAEREAELGHS